MSIEIVLEGQLEKETDKEAFSAFLKQVCDASWKGYQSPTVAVDICRKGILNTLQRDRFQ